MLGDVRIPDCAYLEEVGVLGIYLLQNRGSAQQTSAVTVWASGPMDPTLVPDWALHYHKDCTAGFNQQEALTKDQRVERMEKLPGALLIRFSGEISQFSLWLLLLPAAENSFHHLSPGPKESNTFLLQLIHSPQRSLLASFLCYYLTKNFTKLPLL